jgi:hypothetical protein
MHIQGMPYAAYDGNKFLVVWKDYRRNDPYYSDIYGQFVSTTGNLIDSNFPIVQGYYIPYCGANLAFDGRKYLVVWHDCFYACNMLGRFFYPDGDSLGTPFYISFYHSDVGLYQSVAFGSTNFLVVWTGWDTNIHGQLVSQNGSLIGSQLAIAIPDSGDFFMPAVAWDGNNYLVVYLNQQWTSCNYGQFVSPNGINIGPNFQISSFLSPTTLTAALLAWNGNNYLVVWGDARDGSSKIYGQLVSPNGALIGQNFLISTLSPVTWGSVAWNGTYFLVVFECNGDIYGQFVSSNGTSVGSSFPVCSLAGTQSFPITASSNDNFLVVWEDYRNGNWDIYGEIVNEPAIEEINFCNPSELMKIYPTYFTNYVRLPQEECNIYNCFGKFIVKVKNGFWDGKGRNGCPLSSGIYIIKSIKTPSPTWKVIKVR